MGQDRGWRFYNYGANGADSTQEALLLSILLRDKKIPDGLIIYHGFNDYYSSVSGLNAQGYVAHSFDEIINSLFLDLKRRVFEHSQTARLVYFALRLFTGEEKPMPANLPQQVETTVSVMKGNYDLTTALGKAYGFPVYHFLQPMMATGLEKKANLLNDFTNGIFQRYVPPEAERAATQLYGDLRQDGRWIDLSSIFVENQSKNVYIDEVHLGPDGNALVAKYIFQTLVKAEEHTPSAGSGNDLLNQGN
jgi:lysophospholipase L1-like esterase